MLRTSWVHDQLTGELSEYYCEAMFYHISGPCSNTQEEFVAGMLGGNEDVGHMRQMLGSV